MPSIDDAVTDLNWGEPDFIPVVASIAQLISNVPSNTRLRFPSERTAEQGPDPEKTAEETKSQKRVWKPYEIHLDFCETCASYEQGDIIDPCFAGQMLWSCFYGIGYPAPPAPNAGDITYEMIVKAGARTFEYGK